MKHPRNDIEPWRRNLTILWAAQFLGMMAMSLVVPFLPFFVRDLGVTDPQANASWSGLVYAATFITAFFFTPLWGALGDRYGRKFMCVRAMFGLALSQALMGLSTSVEMLFVFRMVQGAISGFISATLAFVSANTPREKSGYAIGILQSASSSGHIIGPLVGGSLADAIGFRPVFFLVAALCTVSAFVVLRFVQETDHERIASASLSSIIDNYRFTLRSLPIRTAFGIILVTQAAALMVQPVFALFVESLETNPEYLATIAGAIFSVAGLAMLIGSPWWGKRNDAKSYQKNLTIAITGAGIAYAAQGFVTEAWQLIVFRSIQGFCLGGILPTLYSYVSKNAPAERRGGIMGIASSMNILASMIGPPAGGVVAAYISLRSIFFITGGLMLSALFIVRTRFIDMRGAEVVGRDLDRPIVETD